MAEPRKMLEKARSYSDWQIDPAMPEKAVVFDPAPTPIPDQVLPFAKALAEAIRSAAGRLVAKSANVDADKFGSDVGAFARFLANDLSSKRAPKTIAVECHGIRFRATAMPNGRYALRRMNDIVPTFQNLNIPQQYRDILLDPGIKDTGGLVLITGTTGAGKSTTVAATVVERLKAYGGYCLSLEDPAEYPLDGWHGDNAGYCSQNEILDGDYETAISTALRMFPSRAQSMLLYGEVLNKDAAAELLSIARAGHLVFATIHANDVLSAIDRLIYFAGKSRGKEDACAMLAGCLKTVWYQRLEHGKPSISVLQIRQPEQAIVHKGDIRSLSQAIELQTRTLRSGQARSSLGVPA